MTIQKIKDSIDNKLGNRVKVICNCARNKKEQYDGVITEIYNYIFIVKLDNNENKSFCYSDILTKSVQIYFDNNV